MSLKTLAKKIFYKLPVRFRCIIIAARSSGVLKVGLGSFIHKSVHILGKEYICIGSNTCLSEGTWLNVNYRKAGEFAINIGNNCFIGKENFFTSGKLISVGDYVLTTKGCRFIGSSHNIDNPEVPYLLTGTTSVHEIKIGVNCFLGVGVTVLGNISIGHGSVIGSNSLVLQDIPPFSLAVGNPARVLKRYSFGQKKWVGLNELTVSDETEMPTENEYLSLLMSKFQRPEMPWIAAGKSMGNL